MNSTVIKFVAGAGKTTYSKEYALKNRNGLYLAFTNSVVDEMKYAGCLSSTIDSLFWSYIIPKMQGVIPLIACCAIIEQNEGVSVVSLSAKRIRIDANGGIYNQSKVTDIDLCTSNDSLHNRPDFTNGTALKYIFSKGKLRIDDAQIAGIAKYLIRKHKDKVVKLISGRFSYVIIDEAQDLRDYREEFAKLIFESKIPIIVLGDDNQNIMNGGTWFEQLKADQTRTKTHRCCNGVCNWIRSNMGIEITGNGQNGEYIEKGFEQLSEISDPRSQVLLYHAKAGKAKDYINNWPGESMTIKTAKGQTIDRDIIIVGMTMNKKNLYTAITRTTKNVYSTVKLENEKA